MIIPLLCLCPGAYALSSDNFKVMGDVTRFGFYGMAMVMLFLGPLVRFKSGSLASLWMLISYLLYTRWLCVLSLDFSPYFYDFTSNTGRSTNPRDIFGIHRGHRISQWRMNYYGLEDASFLRNSQQILLALLGLSLLVLFSVLLTYLDKHSCLQTLRKNVQYSLLILGLLFAYEDLVIYALLQLQNLDIDSAVGIVSSVAIGIMVLFAGLFTIFVPGIMYKNRGSVKTGDVQVCVRWLVLIEGTKPGLSYFRYQYYTCYLLQRIVSSCVVVFLYPFPAAQVTILLATEASLFLYLLFSRPYIQPIENILVCLLQSIVCLLVIFESCFLLSWSENEQQFLTFAYIGAYWTGILVCLVRFAVGLYGSRIEEETESEVTKTEVVEGKHEGKMTDVDERIKSQLPNDFYEKMPKNQMKAAGKNGNRVAPMSEVQELNRRFGWIIQEEAV